LRAQCLFSGFGLYLSWGCTEIRDTYVFVIFIGSRITRTHDFGFVALDMTHVRGEDEGVYICRASNALGEAVTTASMKIRSKLLIYTYKIVQFLHYSVTAHVTKFFKMEMSSRFHEE
jgi:hypothetical protein